MYVCVYVCRTIIIKEKQIMNLREMRGWRYEKHKKEKKGEKLCNILIKNKILLSDYSVTFELSLAQSLEHRHKFSVPMELNETVQSPGEPLVPPNLMTVSALHI